MKYIALINIFLVLTLKSIIAQNLPEFDYYSQKYPDEEAVTVSLHIDIDIRIENNKPKIISTYREESMLLTKRTSLLSQDFVNYSDLVKLVDAEAYSLIPENKKFKKLKVIETEDYIDRDHGIFYDDSRTRKFIYRGLVKGAKTVLNYSVSYEEPWLWGTYTFTNGSLLLEKMIITINYPESVSLKWKLFNDDSSRIKVSETKKGRNNKLIFSSSDLPKLNIVSNGPPAKWFVPSLLVGISSFKDKKNNNVEMMSSNENMYQWYNSMVKSTKNTILPEMIELVDSLISNCKNEVEKVERIYYWCQENIRYVAFEDGYSGFIPKSCQEVFLKKYADCKGVSNLLKTLLDIADIKSYLTWIGTYHLPYLRSEFPGKPIDNHMIVTYIDNTGKYYFLDATHDFLNINYPSSFIQTKEALIGINDSSFKIVKIPEVDYKNNEEVDKAFLKIQNNTLTGNGKIILTGYNQFYIEDEIKNKPYQKVKSTFKEHFTRGNNKFSIDTVVVKNNTDRNKYLAFEYKFSIPDYIFVNEDKIFINLNLVKKSNYKQVKLQGRQCGLFFENKESAKSIYELEIPDGYEVEFVPEEINYANDFLGFSLKYNIYGKTIRFEKEIFTDFILLPLNKLEIWNEAMKKLDIAQNKSIVLIKKTKQQ